MNYWAARELVDVSHLTTTHHCPRCGHESDGDDRVVCRHCRTAESPVARVLRFFRERRKTDDPPPAKGGPEGTGLWHFTCMNDGKLWPVGYCGPWDACSCATLERGYQADPDCQDCCGRGAILRTDPCPGHPTPEEACEHYRRYLIDHARIEPADAELAHGDRSVTTHYCQAASHQEREVALFRAWVPYPAVGHAWWLCQEHANKAALDELVPDVGGMMTS